jgi:hypothetical protein
MRRFRQLGSFLASLVGAGTRQAIIRFSAMRRSRILRGTKRRHHRARLALVVAVLGILLVLTVRGIGLLRQGPEIVALNESPPPPLHYRSPSPDVLPSPHRPRLWSI